MITRILLDDCLDYPFRLRDTCEAEMRYISSVVVAVPVFALTFYFLVLFEVLVYELMSWTNFKLTPLMALRNGGLGLAASFYAGRFFLKRRRRAKRHARGVPSSSLAGATRGFWAADMPQQQKDPRSEAIPPVGRSASKSRRSGKPATTRRKARG